MILMIIGAVGVFTFTAILTMAEEDLSFDNFTNYKSQKYSDITIGGEEPYYCEWKPDGINDGYKICEPVVSILNNEKNAISLVLDKSNFDFYINKGVKDIKYYYSTDFAIVKNKSYPNSYAVVFGLYVIVLSVYLGLLSWGPDVETREGLLVLATGQKMIVYLGMICLFIQFFGAFVHHRRHSRRHAA